MNKPSWETEKSNKPSQSKFNKPSWEQPTENKPNLAMLNRVTPEDAPKTQTPLDQSRYNIAGQSIIPRYQEDAPLAAAGKDIVNYGLGTVARIFGAPQQALMQGSRSAANAVQGKPQDFTKMNFAKDILGADENNIPANLAGMALDPATYIGGGIIDDLARAGQFGKSATLGTTENLLNRGTQQSKLNIPLSQQTATRGYLNAERNAAKRIETPDVIYGKETGTPQQLALPPAKKDTLAQVKYSIPKNPKSTTKWMETEFGNIPVKTKSGEGAATAKTTLPPKKPQQTLFSENLIDRPFVTTKAELPKGNLKRLELKPNTINQPMQKAAQNGAQDTKKAVNILKDDPVYKEILDGIEGAKVSTDDTIKNIATQINDKSGLTLNIKDTYRNFRDAFGKNFNYVKQKYLDPFDASKKSYVDEVKANTDTIYNKVVKGLGINKGSKESAAVQNYGEGVKIIKGEEVPYTEADLLKGFGAEKAAKIKQADAIFRQQYDQLIDRVNAVRAQIYPNNAEKQVPKRSDYYRHFKEMAEGFAGLKNIFDTPSQIDPKLAGISEFVKPKSKWASYMQKRGLGEYKADAVGGFLDYIQPASYSIHIDPNIAKFRGLAKDIAEGTAETRNANNTIKWLNDFANNLAGKTNKYDRVIQEDIPGGRAALSAVSWMNNRIKANEVLGKFSSMVSQVANVPVAIARIKNPVALTKGAGQTLAQIVGKGNKVLKDSQFINERYMSELTSRFNNKLIDKPKELAVWLMQGADKLGTLFTWNSAYNQAVAKGIKNPVNYADNLARSVVAGRGIGEVPIWQQARRNQLIAPFQLEVTNLWHNMGDMVKTKDFGGIALLLLGNYMFNSATEKLTGNRVVFDPIDAMMDVLSEENTNAVKVGGRLAGEVLSNVPLGQTAAAMYPEYGADITTPVGNVSLPSRKELFGDSDPTRFGGGLLITKALTDPLYKLIPSFGGSQLKKTIEGVQSVNKGMVEKDGKMRFPVSKDPLNFAQSALFGKYSTPEAREYFSKDRRPLSEKQTEQVKKSLNPKTAYEDLMKRRKIETLKGKINTIQKDRDLTDEEKDKEIKRLRDLLTKESQR